MTKLTVFAATLFVAACGGAEDAGLIPLDAGAAEELNAPAGALGASRERERALGAATQQDAGAPDADSDATPAAMADAAGVAQAADAGQAAAPDAEASGPWPPGYFEDWFSNPCHERARTIAERTTLRLGNTRHWGTGKNCGESIPGPGIFVVSWDDPVNDKWTVEYGHGQAANDGTMSMLPPINVHGGWPNDESITLPSGIRITENHCHPSIPLLPNGTCKITADGKDLGYVVACLRNYKPITGPAPGGVWEKCTSYQLD